MDDASPRRVQRRVPVGAAGERLDKLLARWYPALPRSRVQDWIRSGLVQVGGVAITRPATPVEAGTVVRVEPPKVAIATPADAPPLVVLVADPEFLVIDKPAGQIVHPRAGRGRGDSVAEVAERDFGPLPRAQGDERPGIVHRLDVDTSGVLLLARTEHAAESFLAQFRERTVEKTYLAIVEGDPRFDSEWIDAPIERHPRSPERMRIAAEGEGRDAETYYEVRGRFGAAALLECRPRTGRTHQIRVHLEHVGLPILGDRLYAGGRARRPGRSALPSAPRQMLHAVRLAFDHPTEGRRVTVDAPVPDDVRTVLAALEPR